MAISPTFVALVVTSVVALCRGQGQDMTLQPGAMGPAVVDAVVERIRSRCVFSEDRLFLRRVAHVISNDGRDSATYRPNFDGGIWQVNQTMLAATQACSNYYIRSACNNITSAFNIDWSAVTWSDLRKPLYSGLAAALSTLLSLRNGQMAGSVSEQADLYVHIFGRDRTDFTSRAGAVSQIECNDDLDLAFILDSSGSVSDSDFALMLKFAADVISAMNETTVRVADIVYSNTVRVEFDFSQYSNKAQARSKMLATYKLDSGTNTALGLDQAAVTLYSSVAGARGHAKKVAVLVTDGRSNSFPDTSRSAANLRDQGTTVFAVGVGNYNLRELQAVASDPICSHVLTLTSFDHIQSILTEIQKSTCNANVKIPATGPVTRPLKTGEPTTVEARVPVLPNNTVEASVSCGILDIYVSTSDPKPSPAVYDDRYRATPLSPAQLTVTERLPSGAALYITVIGTRLPDSLAALRNCTDFNWTIGVTKKTNISVICEEDGVRRPCTKSDVIKAKLCDAQDEALFPVDNPCTTDTLKKGVLRHPHPYDPTRFLQCDLKGRSYVTLCPGGENFNTQTRECGFTSPGEPGVQENNVNVSSTNSTTFDPAPTAPPSGGNPCTVQALAKNKFYHKHASDETKFIQCDAWGRSWVMTCRPSTVWSQADYTCIKKAKVTATQSSSPAVTCSSSDSYLPDPCDHHAYYRCVHQQPHRTQCFPASLFFDPASKVCGFVDLNTAPIPAGC